jgi:hypothetical protein
METFFRNRISVKDNIYLCAFSKKEEMDNALKNLHSSVRIRFRGSKEALFLLAGAFVKIEFLGSKKFYTAYRTKGMYFTTPEESLESALMVLARQQWVLPQIFTYFIIYKETGINFNFF